MLRQFQKDGDARAANIVAGRVVDRKTVCEATPGAGKSKMAARFAGALIDAGKVDFALWLCPRISLVSQVREQFAKEFNDRKDPRKQYRMRDDATRLHSSDLRDGFRGDAATYQAVVFESARAESARARGKARKESRFVEAFKSHRGVLILDEHHHLSKEESAAWTTVAEPLIALAGHVLIISGYLDRHDGHEVAHVDYRPVHGGQRGAREPVVHVKYPRRLALDDGAIRPIEFHYVDGFAKYARGDVVKTLQSLKEAKRDEAERALGTVLRDKGYSHEFLRRGLASLAARRVAFVAKYPKCKKLPRGIIVCQNQKVAKELVPLVAAHGFAPVLAITDEKGSLKAIKRFREEGCGDVLVTVDMAYEGLDVPDVTHIICLTNKRSLAWLLQCFARAGRAEQSEHGAPYKEQYATIFVPDDPPMCRIVERIIADGGAVVFDKKQGSTYEQGERTATVPVDSGVTTTEIGFEGERETATDSTQVELARQKYPTIFGAAKAGVVLDILRDPELRDLVRPVAAAVAASTPKQLRDFIQEVATEIDRVRGVTAGTTNKELYREFRISRTRAPVATLQNMQARVLEMRREAFA